MSMFILLLTNKRIKLYVSIVSKSKFQHARKEHITRTGKQKMEYIRVKHRIHLLEFKIR
uniref:Uncharacterized protein n=1 Tax=Arundo donax TaxID=35708 RepID=A0A0A8ZBT4_ARUDO